MCSFLGFWKCAEANAASVASSVVDSFHESSRADDCRDDELTYCLSDYIDLCVIIMMVGIWVILLGLNELKSIVKTRAKLVQNLLQSFKGCY
jgi:hypothetical protein